MGKLTETYYTDLYPSCLPIAQLTCKGPGCKVFQPDVVQCTNMGDDGLGNIQWKVRSLFQATVYIILTRNMQCDTDLPSSLRLGKVDVSCEGWSAPGDPNILQGMYVSGQKKKKKNLFSLTEKLETFFSCIVGSCGLTYNLYKVNKGLEYGEDPYSTLPSSYGPSLFSSSPPHP